MDKSRQKKALERLTSPEQLDKLLVIIRMPGWIALLCAVAIVAAVLIWSFVGSITMTANGTGIYFQPEAVELIQSRTDDYISKVNVEQGDEVKKDDVLIVLNSSQTIKAPSDGTILSVEVLAGEATVPGKNLIWFQNKEAGDSRPNIYSFFPLESGGGIKVGMKAQMSFNSVDSTIYGKLQGKVVKVLPFSATIRGSVLKSIPSEKLKNYLTGNQATLVVVIEPTKAETPSGYLWTTPKGPDFPLNFGAVAHVEIFLEQRRPIDYLIPVTRLKGTH